MAEKSHEEFLVDREKAAVEYHQLGRKEAEVEEELDMDEWGNAKGPDGRIFSTYTDKAFIKQRFTDQFKPLMQTEKGSVVADIGGADGFVGKTVKEQLAEYGYDQVNLVVADIMEAKLDKLMAENPKGDVHGVYIDLLETKLWPDSVDLGIMRFVLPYSSREQMPQLLANVYHAMAPGGRVVILQDGAMDRTRGEMYDQFYAEVTAAQTGQSVDEVHEHRYFTSGEELAEVAESVGFKVREVKELCPTAEAEEDRIEGYLSPEAYDSRFKLGDKLGGVTGVFKKWKEEMDGVGDVAKLEFVGDPENPENIRMERGLLYCILEK